jgi:hypothetical protein
MTEFTSPERDHAALMQCRARVADTHARLAMFNEVVSRAEPDLPYARAVRGARDHLEAALLDLDRARAVLEEFIGA